ncbi:hypothetical protein HYC85_014109 [Camellia sinensis]|uniref:Uncharacterized protein n=1 Tax=Camellia sinensis TaxID=4442 RepID=A0A7J7H5A2_CAMSI|nr:hypothetical protein HYC85_014109 [Camellia sinensis]
MHNMFNWHVFISPHPPPTQQKKRKKKKKSTTGNLYDSPYDDNQSISNIASKIDMSINANEKRNRQPATSISQP